MTSPSGRASCTSWRSASKLAPPISSSSLASENGKVVPEASFEVGMAAPGTALLRRAGTTEYGRVAEWEPGHFSLLVREPIGVAGISVPWNSPVALLIRSLAPALAAGCTTVVMMPGQTAESTRSSAK